MDFVTLVAVSVVFFLLIFYYYGTSNHRYWKDRGVPFEPPLPFFGNLLDMLLFRRNQGQIVQEIYMKHPNSPVVGMFNFGDPVLLVREPALCQQVLITDYNCFSHNEIDIDPVVDPILSKNLFACRGVEWKKRRQVLSPAFTAAKIKPTYHKILNCADKLVEYIDSHPGEHQVKDLVARYTSEVVAQWGLGIDGHSFSSKEDAALVRLGKSVFDPTIKTAVIFILNFLFPSITKLFKIRFVPKEVPDFFDYVIRDILHHRQTTETSQPDYLQHFIDLQKKLQDKPDEFVSNDDIIGGVVTFFVEGYETSSIAGSFMMYFLAMNPDVQEKLRTEVLQAKELTFDSISEMSYMDLCFKESLRLAVALGNMSKVCTAPTEIAGVAVEPGTTVIVPLLALHMDPNIWPNPDKFDPMRFSEENRGSIPKGAYIPFGDGPRICVGYRLATTTIKAAVARILQEWAIVPSARTPPRFEQNPRHFMASQKGGLYLQFKKLPKQS